MFGMVMGRDDRHDESDISVSQHTPKRRCLYARPSYAIRHFGTELRPMRKFCTHSKTVRPQMLVSGSDVTSALSHYYHTSKRKCCPPPPSYATRNVGIESRRDTPTSHCWSREATRRVRHLTIITRVKKKNVVCATEMLVRRVLHLATTRQGENVVRTPKVTRSKILRRDGCDISAVTRHVKEHTLHALPATPLQVTRDSPSKLRAIRNLGNGVETRRMRRLTITARLFVYQRCKPHLDPFFFAIFVRGEEALYILTLRFP
jgi:hypothetical protein